MIRLSANISILFPDLPFLDRFAAARAAGFDAVECWFPYEHPVETLRDLLKAHDLKLIGINTVPGGEGEWGFAAVPGGEARFREHLGQALDYAQALGVTGIHVMAGMVRDRDPAACLATYEANLAWAARQAEGSGVTLLIEPLNAQDRPGYLVSTSDLCVAIIDRIGAANLKLMFDVYHIQISEGDLLRRLERHFARIGHIQVAAVPSRAEPDEGEVDYRTIFAAIERLGWPGYVGCEYKPRADTVAGLTWVAKLIDGKLPTVQRNTASS